MLFQSFPETLKPVPAAVIRKVAGDAADPLMSQAGQQIRCEIAADAVIGRNEIVENIVNGVIKNDIRRTAIP